MSPNKRRSRGSRAPGRSRADRFCIPNHALVALEQQARRHYRRWRLDQAAQIASRVVRFDARRPSGWFVLGDVQMRRMNWQKAFGCFEQVVKRRRQAAIAWCRGGEALFRLRDYKTAQRWWRQAVAVAPDTRDVGGRRARRLLDRHSHTLAKAMAAAEDDDAVTRPISAVEADQPVDASEDVTCQMSAIDSAPPKRRRRET